MDIVRRNLLLTEDETLCFLDWEFAGFYPPYFQIFCLKWCSSDEPVFVDKLLAEIPSTDGKEQEVTLGEILRINTRYSPPGLKKSSTLEPPQCEQHVPITPLQIQQYVPLTSTMH